MFKKLIQTGLLVFVLTTIMAFGFPEPAIEMPADSVVPIDHCRIENNAFQHGEEIVYKVYYNWNFVWLAAGEVVMRVQEKGNQYHISAHGRTYKSYEWFYKVRDKYDTYIDKETLLPNVSIRDVAEGKYRLYDEITFDKRRNIATSKRGKSKETAEVKEYPIESCMHDLLSIIYYARNLNFDNLNAGDQVPVKIFIDKETWPLKVVYKGKDDNKKIKGEGRYETILFSPEVIVGDIFKEGTEMNVWVSDDKNKIPLLIESPVSVGSVKAVFKEYRGLRHEMNAEAEK